MKKILAAVFLFLVNSVTYATPETVTLELVKVDRALSIHAKGLAISCNVGHSGYSLFLFDTGSSGLFSAVAGDATDQGTSFLQSYESGISFCGTAYSGSIDFGSGVSISNAVFGHIDCAQGAFYNCTCTTSPCTTTTPPGSCFPTSDVPQLYGTFGASLITNKNAPDIFTLMAQMPGNLSTGFIVQTGGYPGNSPKLVVGLTDDNRKGFITAKLTPEGFYPNGSVAWDDRSLKAATSVSFEGENQNIQYGSILFDTGNPNAHISPTGSLNPNFLTGSDQRLQPGVLFDAVVNDAVNWSFPAGNTVSKDTLFVTSPVPNKTYMSAGIEIFYRYNVMYDIKNGMIGFQPISQIDVGTYPDNTVLATPIGDTGSIPTSLVQSEPKNVFLTADNTYSNGTIISSGEISVYRDSNLGDVSGGVVLNGGTLRIEDHFSTARSIAVFSAGGAFDPQTFSATFTGPLNGKGTLSILGNGVTTFASALGSFFQGTVEIQGGTFVANGSLETAAVLVDAGGTLKGVGPIGTVLNNGVVHPGNSPGIMYVQSYTQSPTGTLDIEILNTSVFSQLIVANTASLDGSLDVRILPGNSLNAGDSFPIIQAGGVSGTFAQVNYFNLPAYFDPTIIYQSNAVILLLNGIPYPNIIQEAFTSINENNFRILKRMDNLRNPCRKYSSNFYFSPVSNIGDVKSKKSAVGYDYWTTGGVVGFDYAFRSGGFGIVGDFEKVYADVDRNWGKFNINQLRTSAYATYGISDFALNAIIFGGRDWYSFRRNSFAGRTKSSPKGYAFGTLFGLDYNYRNLTPFANVQYIHDDIDSYKEHSYRVGSQTANSLRTTIGLKMDHCWNIHCYELTPKFNIAWQRELLDKARHVSLGLLNVALPGTSRNIGLLGVDFHINYNQTVCFEFSYELEYAKLATNNNFYLECNIPF